jgi:hypothetical protein
MSFERVNTWTEFAIVIIGGVGLIGLMILAVPVLALWNAWWVAKIWASFVVPTTHWPIIPQAAFFAIILIHAAFSRPTPEIKGSEYKHGQWLVSYALAGPVAFASCWLVFRWWF